MGWMAARMDERARSISLEVTEGGGKQRPLPRLIGIPQTVYSSTTDHPLGFDDCACCTEFSPIFSLASIRPYIKLKKISRTVFRAGFGYSKPAPNVSSFLLVWVRNGFLQLILFNILFKTCSKKRCSKYSLLFSYVTRGI